MKRLAAIILVSLTLAATQAMANWVFDPAVFEPTYYADENQDVYAKLGYDGKKLAQHWGNFGIKEGRRSSPVFDVRFYLQKNPGVAGAGDFVKAAEHWYNFGRKEGRASHPDFNVRKYLELNQEVAREIGQQNYLEAINHYLRVGYKKGLKAK